MYINEFVEKSFVLIQADWPAAKARNLIQRILPAYVIVHRIEPSYDPPDYYYLYSRREALDRLEGAPPDERVDRWFNLHESDATETHEVLEAAEPTFERAVVLENGRVTGYVDFAAPSWPFESIGEETFGGSGRGEADDNVSTRHLATQLPERIPLDELVSLLVWLAVESPTTGAALPIAVPTGSKVDIVVQALKGVELIDRRENTLTVSGELESLPIQFKLKGTELGPAKIRILAFQDGNSLGAITLVPTVVMADELTSDELAIARERPLMVTGVDKPDLLLIISEHMADGRPAFTFRVESREPGIQTKDFGPIKLRTDPQNYFREFFLDIENLPLNNEGDRKRAARRLSGKGLNLYKDLIPDDLRVLLWSLRDQIHSVQIQSDEPWIPWELCKLQGQDAQGRVEEGEFFCEAFAITRWLPQVQFKPKLKLKEIALVVPEDSGLEYAPDERDYVLSLGNGQCKVTQIPATFEHVYAAMEAGTYDGWHFTGHGNNNDDRPNRAVLELDDADFMPEDVSGHAESMGVTQPLVFLNACQTGYGAMSLTGIGGWAEKFLNAAYSEQFSQNGAAAFIGTYWSINDALAVQFARAFYDSLFAGNTIGEAAQAARLAIQPSGDPSWLAYTIFAHPMAKLEQ